MRCSPFTPNLSPKAVENRNFISYLPFCKKGEVHADSVLSFPLCCEDKA
jgi:hypothetical protein